MAECIRDFSGQQAVDSSESNQSGGIQGQPTFTLLSSSGSNTMQE